MEEKRNQRGSKKRSTSKRATTDEGRELEIQNLAMNLAYERLKNGTASNDLIKEVLKSGSAERRLKREIMEEQRDLLRAKREAIKSQEQTEVDYKKVLVAIRTYNGLGTDDTDEDIFGVN